MKEGTITRQSIPPLPPIIALAYTHSNNTLGVTEPLTELDRVKWLMSDTREEFLFEIRLRLARNCATWRNCFFLTSCSKSTERHKRTETSYFLFYLFLIRL